MILAIKCLQLIGTAEILSRKIRENMDLAINCLAIIEVKQSRRHTPLPEPRVGLGPVSNAESTGDVEIKRNIRIRKLWSRRFAAHPEFQDHSREGGREDQDSSQPLVARSRRVGRSLSPQARKRCESSDQNVEAVNRTNY